MSNLRNTNRNISNDYENSADELLNIPLDFVNLQDNDIIQYDITTNSFKNESPTTAGLVANAQNTGGFNEVFKNKVGTDLIFRTIQSSDSTATITQNVNDIDIIVPPPLVIGQAGQPLTLNGNGFTFDTGNININGGRITSQGAGVNPTDGINKNQLDTAISGVNTIYNNDSTINSLRNVTFDAGALSFNSTTSQAFTINTTGGVNLQGSDTNLNNNKIINLSPAISGTDAVNYNQLLAVDAKTPQLLFNGSFGGLNNTLARFRHYFNVGYSDRTLNLRIYIDNNLDFNRFTATYDVVLINNATNGDYYNVKPTNRDNETPNIGVLVKTVSTTSAEIWLYLIGNIISGSVTPDLKVFNYAFNPVTLSTVGTFSSSLPITKDLHVEAFNIYQQNGTIEENRRIEQGTNALSFRAGGSNDIYLQVNGSDEQVKLLAPVTTVTASNLINMTSTNATTITADTLNLTSDVINVGEIGANNIIQGVDTNLTLQNTTGASKLSMLATNCTLEAVNSVSLGDPILGILYLRSGDVRITKFDLGGTGDDRYIVVDNNGSLKTLAYGTGAMPVGEIQGHGDELNANNFNITSIVLNTLGFTKLNITSATLKSNNVLFSSPKWDQPVSSRLRYIGDRLNAHFHCAFSVSAKVDNINAVYTFAVVKNSIVENDSLFVKDFSSNNEYTTIAYHKVVTLSTNEYLEVFVRTDTTTRTITIQNLNIVAIAGFMEM